MRLSHDQIKQGILHPAREVRDAAAYYFGNSFSPDPTIMPLVIQAIEERGWDDAFGMYSFLGDLVQTEETLRWAIARLGQRGQPDNEQEARLTLWLLDVLAHADPELLQAHEEEIRELDAVDEGVREAVEARILLHGFTAEKLWAEIEEFCDRNKSEDYVSDEDLASAHRVVEALGRHPGEFDDRVLSILSQEIENYTDNPVIWMEPCIVRLAGELQLQRAVPLLVRKLQEDDETLNADCIRALVKIGTDEVVDALADAYGETEWGFRFSAIEVFENVHSDRSVERCVGLLEREDDIDLQCRLCEAILGNFAEEGIEPARRLLLENDLTPDLIDVRNALLAATMLMGVELPESERWREEAKHDVAFRQKWYAEHYLGAADVEYLGEDDEDYDDEPLLPPDTVVRERKKVGRNDPCPCGSGKKYKKCCLKKGNGAGLFE
jgi:hypothetical protein